MAVIKALFTRVSQCEITGVSSGAPEMLRCRADHHVVHLPVLWALRSRSRWMEVRCVFPSLCARVLIFSAFGESSEEARIHLEQQRKIRSYFLAHPIPGFYAPVKVMPFGEHVILRDGLMNHILIGRGCQHFYK